MKGLKLLTIVAVGLFCLTGCGEKTLECTLTEEDDYMKMVQTMSLTFKDDQITNAKMSIDTTVKSENAQENWSDFVDMMESQYEETDADGVKVTTEEDADNYSFNLTVEADITKASEETLAEYDLADFADNAGTYEENKEEAEANGFVCK